MCSGAHACSDSGLSPSSQRSWNDWRPRLGLPGVSPTSGYITGPKRPALLTSAKHVVLRLWLWTRAQHRCHRCLCLSIASLLWLLRPSSCWSAASSRAAPQGSVSFTAAQHARELHSRGRLDWQIPGLVSSCGRRQVLPPSASLCGGFPSYREMVASDWLRRMARMRYTPS